MCERHRPWGLLERNMPPVSAPTEMPVCLDAWMRGGSFFLTIPSFSMPHVDTPDLTSVLESATTIAVVGCSATPTRTSHKIARYMQQRGYRIVPVNPNYDEVLGEHCYPDLPSIPSDVTIDIVDIFRAPKHTADMVRTAIARIEDTNEHPVIWTQLGVSTPEARELAADAGLPYVRNRCIKVEYDRLIA
jgi:predicted CoA-binding protein